MGAGASSGDIANSAKLRNNLVVKAYNARVPGTSIDDQFRQYSHKDQVSPAHSCIQMPISVLVHLCPFLFMNVLCVFTQNGKAVICIEDIKSALKLPADQLNNLLGRFDTHRVGAQYGLSASYFHFFFNRTRLTTRNFCRF